MDFTTNDFRIGELTIGDRTVNDVVINDRPQSKLFGELARELLAGGSGIRFQARGASMSPAIRDGEIVHVRPAVPRDLRRGDLVLIKVEGRLCLHRLVVADVKRDVFITRGDCGLQDDPAVSGEEVLGVAESKEVRVGRGMVRAKLKGVRGRVARCAARGQRVFKKLLGGARGGARAPVIFGLVFVLVAATAVRAQVAVDATTSGSADAAGTANGGGYGRPHYDDHGQPTVDRGGFDQPHQQHGYDRDECDLRWNSAHAAGIS